MTDKDFKIEALMRVPDGSTISAKPCYLITLHEKSSKGKEEQKRFISHDLPKMESSFVYTKGVFSDATEEEIKINFRTLLEVKDQWVEMWCPWHSIMNIKSLVFKAK